MANLKPITTCLTYAVLFTFCGSAYAQTTAPESKSVRILINTSNAPIKPSRELLPIALKGKCGFINGSGKIVVKPGFDSCADFYEGLAVLTIGTKSTVIDKNGHAVFEPQLPLLDNYFSNGLMRVCGLPGKVCGPIGYLDRRGRVAIKPQFEIAHSFSDGRALVSVDGKWGYIDKTGRLVVAPTFLNAATFSDGLARVYMVDGGPRWSYIDKAGKVVLNQPFDAPGRFLNGFAPVQKNGRWSVIDKTGKIAFDPQPNADRYQVHEGTEVMEGLLRITSGRGCNLKWGYADVDGKIVIRPQFERAQDFSEGLAAVQVGVGGKWGYIDRTGEMVIQPQFDLAHTFIEGIARVEIGHWVSRRSLVAAAGHQLRDRSDLVYIDDPIWDGEIGYIDRTGRYIWRPTK